jgi:hypothetical protein
MSWTAQRVSGWVRAQRVSGSERLFWRLEMCQQASGWRKESWNWKVQRVSGWVQMRPTDLDWVLVSKGSLHGI